MKVVKPIVRAFIAAQEFFAVRGGVFGCPSHYAKAFCNVVGESPAIQSIIKGFGGHVQAVFSTKGLAAKVCIRSIRYLFPPTGQTPGVA